MAFIFHVSEQLTLDARLEKTINGVMQIMENNECYTFSRYQFLTRVRNEQTNFEGSVKDIKRKSKQTAYRTQIIRMRHSNIKPTNRYLSRWSMTRTSSSPMIR